MSRVTDTHADWLGLLEPRGQFLTLPVIRQAFPDGLDRTPDATRDKVRGHLLELDDTGTAGRTGWLEYLLRDVLGWGKRLRSGPAVPAHLTHTVAEKHIALRADYALVQPATATDSERTRALVVRFDSGIGLTSRIPGEKWTASPIERVTLLCRATGVPIGIATDGDLFTLVWAPLNAASGYATWPTRLLGEEPVLLDALTSLLGAKRFFSVQASDGLDQLLLRSASAQHDVTAQLGRQVRQAVELLVSALSRANNEHGGRLLAGIDPHVIYEASATVMMRLVFLLYAEEHRLLPLGDALYDSSYAASTLREELRAEADLLGDEPLELRTSAWHRLLATFRAVHSGVEHDLLRLPAYGGSLFDPDRFAFLEGRSQGTSWRAHPSAPLPVDDLTVLAVLNALQVLEIRAGGVTESRKLSFRTLAVEQIGNVYEGLLDHGAKRVDAVAVGLIGKAGQEAEVALSDIAAYADNPQELHAYLSQRTGKSASWVQTELARPATPDEQRLLRTACENDDLVVQQITPYVHMLRNDLRGLPMVFRPGSVYVTTTTARRDSGTEYTTQELAEEIVRHALEPLVYSPGPRDGTPREKWQLRSATELLGLRIADPAVGSGAILVAACRYLADRVVEAWVADGTVSARENLGEDSCDVVVDARRAVAEHCLYGVDRDGMAVEMAKLSLWLTTMARERPFSFLDHALRAGDSLIGVHDLRQVERLHIDPGRRDWQLDFGKDCSRHIADALVARRDLESIHALTVRDTEEQARLNQAANTAVGSLQVIADLVVGAALSLPLAKAKELDDRMLGLQKTVTRALDPEVDESERTQLLEELAQQADAWLNAGCPSDSPMRRPLHWPLAFPEVFASGGFSAIVGNPPYIGNTYWKERLGSDMQGWVARLLKTPSPGRVDLCAVFVRRAWQLLAPKGTAGLLAPHNIAIKASGVVSTQYLATNGAIYRARTGVPWPGTAAVVVNLLWFARSWTGTAEVNGTTCTQIDGSLRSATLVARLKPKPLRSGLWAFQGTDNSRAERLVFAADDQWKVKLEAANSPYLHPFISGTDLADHALQGETRWCVDPLDASLEAVRATCPVTADYLEQVVRPSRPPELLETYDGLIERWWQFWRHRAPDYRQLRKQPTCLAAPTVAKYWFALHANSSWVFNKKVRVIGGLPPAQELALHSDIFDAWVWEYSGRMGAGISVTLDALASFPLPEAGGDDQGLSQAWVTQLLEASSRYGGVTNTLNAFHDPANTDPSVLKLRGTRGRINLAVAQALGLDAGLVVPAFITTNGGSRYGLADTARDTLLAALLEINLTRSDAEDKVSLPKKSARGRKRATAIAAAPGALTMFPELLDPEVADPEMFAADSLDTDSLDTNAKEPS